MWKHLSCSNNKEHNNKIVNSQGSKIWTVCAGQLDLSLHSFCYADEADLRTIIIIIDLLLRMFPKETWTFDPAFPRAVLYLREHSLVENPSSVM